MLCASAVAHCFAGHWSQALEEAEAVVGLAQTQGQPALALDAHRVRALSLSQLGRAEQAVQVLEATRHQVERLGTPRQRYELEAARAYALNQANRLAECAEALATAVQLAGEAGDLAEVMSSRHHLAATHLLRGHAERAWSEARALRVLREHVGAPEGPHQVMNDMADAAMAMLSGRYTEAMRLLEQALPKLQAIGPMVHAVGCNHLASLWLLLGQWHRAELLLQSAPVPGDGHLVVGCRRVVLRARLARLRRPADAADLAPGLEQELSGLDGHTDPKHLASLKLELSRCAPAARALQLTREVLQFAQATGLDGVALHARLREAELLLPTDEDGAARAADWITGQSAELFPMDGSLPEVWLVCARVAEHSGDPARAAGLVRRAAQWVDAVAESLEPRWRRSYRDEVPLNLAIAQALRQLDTRREPCSNPVFPTNAAAGGVSLPVITQESRGES